MTAEFSMQTLIGLEADSPQCLDWIDAYVRGVLDGEVLDAFEDFLMVHPDLLSHIEAAELLHAQRIAKIPSRKSVWQITWTLVATILLAVFVGFFAGANWQVAPQSHGLKGEISLSTTRSNAVQIEVPFVPGARLLTITLPPNVSGGVAVQIEQIEGNWQSHLTDVPVDLGMVLIMVPELAPGSYRANVSQSSNVLHASEFFVLDK